MHRVTWSAGPQALSWSLPNGAHTLPPAIAASTTYDSIVIVDTIAFLVSDSGLTKFSATSDATGDGWRLALQPEPQARPVALGHERTRSDDALASNALVQMFDDEGREIVIGDAPRLIGRHPSCDVPTVDRRVSLFHCAVVRCGGGIRVLDLGSRNGTLVDGTRVGSALITREASLRVGRRRFEIRVVETRDDTMIFASQRMQALHTQIARIAPTNATIMLTGESGSGKEVIARRLHAFSGRTGQFVAINAAVLSETLATSELFGHVRGSFTGADNDRVGAFAAADGGTLFLDEVAELSPSVQAELLRAVELRTIRRIGESHERRVDVRLVVATHRRLDEMVVAEQFREDLYHRLAVITFEVPALRDRPEDLTVITERFLASQSPVRSLSGGAWNKLRGHTWPGNVRELLNTLKRACLMHDSPTLGAEDIELKSPKRAASLDHLIHNHVVADYEANGRSAAITARNLGLQRRTVYRLVRDQTRAAAYLGRSGR